MAENASGTLFKETVTEQICRGRDLMLKKAGAHFVEIIEILRLPNSAALRLFILVCPLSLRLQDGADGLKHGLG